MAIHSHGHFQLSVVALLAMVVLCVSMAAQVSAQSWPAPAPFMRGYDPPSAPGYAPEYAPTYASAWAPEYAPAGSPMYAPLPYIFTPSPSISFTEPNMAPGPMSA